MVKELIGLQLLAFILGFILDLIIGDPHNWPHIVRVIGAVISGLEKRLNNGINKRLRGVILVVVTIAISVGTTALVLIVAYIINPWIYLLVEGLIVWQCLALKSLRDESQKVLTSLHSGGIEEARSAVSMIVGRDTAVLDECGVVKATVETVAENASDGVGAPLFYILFFGAIGGVLYKTVNTMDSMIGYKNDKYMEFGRCAAKLDDVFNYVPSRVCALMMVLASGISGFDMKNAYYIWKRDRYNHASPNSAQTESVMAGALDVRLAGNAYYFGKLVEKPYIGDDIREIKPEDINASHKILFVTGLLLFALIIVLRGLIYAAI